MIWTNLRAKIKMLCQIVRHKPAKQPTILLYCPHFVFMLDKLFWLVCISEIFMEMLINKIAPSIWIMIALGLFRFSFWIQLKTVRIH